VALGDGSVRRIDFGIQPITWWDACTPNTGEVMPSDW
jgi:hypothetical protein